MNALDASEHVLRDEGKPMHFREITRRILDREMWQTMGETPWATVNAQLAMDIKNKGPDSRFQRTKPGVFALREWGLAKYVPKKAGKATPKKGEKAAKMSFTNAAEYVLKNYADHRPMHYREITDKVLELDLIHTEGRTPAATLYAQVLTEIKRHTLRGDTPRFAKYGKGYVGLRKWMGEGLAFQIRRHNAEVRKKLMARLQAMDPEEFEALVAQLLVALGFEAKVTSYSKDGGIDVRATLVVGDVIKTRMAIQVKRWTKKNVTAPVVQQVRGSLGTHEQGLIITVSDFSAGARKEANRADATPVALMNGRQLVDLLIENDIGVQRARYDLIELEEAD
jgi:restriction system protein